MIDVADFFIDGHAWHMDAVGGATVMMPGAAANQEAAPQNATRQPGLGFAMAKMIAVLCETSKRFQKRSMPSSPGHHRHSARDFKRPEQPSVATIDA
jgi:hypothetical protein